ncbi:hypothetical protein DVA86_02150 [Streptomyces armeniacus]|uniref:Uncharacterized protein n=1 Tax=Streptomyces armeniacus TaxID=83291 RepID=A0A345XJ06_9ACTN|nr:hypothetical protein DVA86_02150 [Streptomyces armeniacus]
MAVAALTVSGLALGTVAAGSAQAVAPAPAGQTATCAEINEQVWSFKNTQALAECHGKRAARAAERAQAVLGNAPGAVAKEWSRKAPNLATDYAEKANSTQDVKRAAGYAFRSSQEAATLSGSATPAMGPGGFVVFAPTNDRGYDGADLTARQAARQAWDAAARASRADGVDVRLNIIADRAEVRAWETARAANWIK